MVCGGVLLGLWVVATGQDSTALGSLGVAQVGFWVGLLGAVVVTSRRGATGSVVRDFGLRFRPIDLPLGAGLGVAPPLLVVPLIYFPFRSVIDRSDLERPARELADRAHGPGFLVLALVVAVGAPVVGELFWRGLLLRSLERYLAGVPLALLSAPFCAASHLCV